MKHYLLKRWSYKPIWHGVSEEERAAFAARITDAVQEIASAGIRTLRRCGMCSVSSCQGAEGCRVRWHSSQLPRNACGSHWHLRYPAHVPTIVAARATHEQMKLKKLPPHNCIALICKTLRSSKMQGDTSTAMR